MEATETKTELTVADEKRLAELVSIVDEDIHAFVRVGRALKEIQETKLWRVQASTFEDFCESHWDYSARQARYLMSGAQVMDVLDNEEEVPRNEAQARELSRAKTAPLIQAAWDMACEEAPKKPNGAISVTATLVRTCVDEVLGKGDDSGDDEKPTPPPTPERPVDPYGRTVPDELIDRFAQSGTINDAIREIKATTGRMQVLGMRAGGEHLDTAEITRLSGQLVNELEFGAYYTCCPDCAHQDPAYVGHIECQICGGSGFLPKATFNRLNDEQKEWLEN